MDRRFFILISTLFVQSLYGASIDVPTTAVNGDPSPSSSLAGTPLAGLSNMTPGDAQVLAELQRLRQGGERFRGEAMQFIQSLPNRLSAGFAQSHQLFQLLATMFSSAVNNKVGPLVQNLQAGGRYLGDSAKNIALEGLRRGQSGLSAGIKLGENALETVRKNGQALLQNGASYLHRGGAVSIQARDLTSQIPAPLKAVPSIEKPEFLPEEYEEGDEYEEVGPEAVAEKGQRLTTREEKGVTTVLTDELSNVGAAGSDMVKNVARFGGGGIRSLLEALSAVLATTTEVGNTARTALSSVNQSGARAIGSAIETGGNIVSGALDKTGSVVGSLKVGAGGAATPPKA